ncbi:hypothetical protein RRG08_043483 [Elysia crispata]|uniref:Uncharacterized protein n=1 Tax=Elysia crispata TaxID=231223 RepID=A0AAE0YG34_9GAST|nr:hypothetical protein RRG08_043483 [Elysia crispata]
MSRPLLQALSRVPAQVFCYGHCFFRHICAQVFCYGHCLFRHICAQVFCYGHCSDTSVLKCSVMVIVCSDTSVLKCSVMVIVCSDTSVLKCSAMLNVCSDTSVLKLFLVKKCKKFYVMLIEMSPAPVVDSSSVRERGRPATAQTTLSFPFLVPVRWFCNIQ